VTPTGTRSGEDTASRRGPVQAARREHPQPDRAVRGRGSRALQTPSCACWWYSRGSGHIVREANTAEMNPTALLIAIMTLMSKIGSVTISGRSPVIPALR
jgi:hypothetical protein